MHLIMTISISINKSIEKINSSGKKEGEKEEKERKEVKKSKGEKEERKGVINKIMKERVKEKWKEGKK